MLRDRLDERMPGLASLTCKPGCSQCPQSTRDGGSALAVRYSITLSSWSRGNVERGITEAFQGRRLSFRSNKSHMELTLNLHLFDYTGAI
jgi:hypothetical protein